MDPSGFSPEAPQSDFGGGSFFSQELGTLLRLQYNTRSYGQEQDGNLDIGTMQVANFDDAIAFFDGQLTLNDYNGPGYNLGLGFRWLDYVPFMWEPERITGVSIWADGTHTEAGNFFPQVGVSYESLGDMWDVRINGYIPLGPRSQTGKFELTGENGFIGNSISELTEAPLDTAFDEAEIEVARRLGAERDAWAFGGGYVLNSGSQDAAGYRLGLRGYAYPDLLLQIAVSDDDIFKTNAAFSIIWFVGRTRTDYQPTCGLPDRFREPVMRNDYVVLSREIAGSGIGLTDPNGDAIRVVHVNSEAAAGGTGTYEAPLNNLDEIDDFSMDGDIVYVWSDTEYSGQSALLQDNQRLFGEGEGVSFGIQTAELGTIAIPETSPGAADGTKPMILDALGQAVTLADANEVINFTIDGGTNGIVAGTDGAGSPTLADLTISNLTGNGIDLTPFVREDPDTGDETVAFDVMIDEVTFDNIGGMDISLNAETDAMVGTPGVTLDEDITISNVTSTNNGGFGINLENTHDGGTVMLTNWSYTDGATALEMDSFNSTFTMSGSTLADSSGAGVNIIGDSAGTFTFNGTNTFDNLDVIAFCVGGGGTFSGTITMQDEIINDAGLSVRIEDMDDDASITFTQLITDTGAGIYVGNNDGGSVNFAGNLMLTTTTFPAVQLDTNSDDTQVDFSGNMTISTTTGTGFLASSGGTISATGAENSINTTTGTAVDIQDSVIGGAGIALATVNVNSAGAANGVLLEDNTGGTVTIGKAGDDPGEGGTIGDTTDAAVRIVNTNTTLNGLQLNNAGNAAGEDAIEVVHNSTENMTVVVNDTEINTLFDGVGASGGGTGTFSMTVSDTTIAATTGTAMEYTNIDGVVNNNNVDIDNATAGVLITGGDGAISFNNESSIQNVSGTDFEVDGDTTGENIVTMAGTITNTAGRSISVHDKAGGSVTFSGTVTDSGTGILIEDNTGGTVNFNNSATYTLTTGANDAVTVTNNAGATTNFNNLDVTTTGVGQGFVANNGGTVIADGVVITTANGDGFVSTGGTDLIVSDIDITSTNGDGFSATGGGDVSVSDIKVTTTGGDGFVASGGGDLTVTGTSNTIATATGVGLQIDDKNIVSQATFESVNVSNGAGSGIILNDVTGSTVTVGESNGAQNSGGSLTTAGDAIQLTNVENVTLNHVRVVNSTGGEGVNIDHTNAATTAMNVTINDLNLDNSASSGISALADAGETFSLRLLNGDLERNVDIDVTGAGQFNLDVEDTEINVSGATDTFSLAFSGDATSGDVTFSDNDFVADTGSGLEIVSSGSAAAKSLRILVADSEFSSVGAATAVDIDGGGNTLMQLTIRGNTFDASGATNDLEIDSNGTNTSRLRLNLGGDDPSEFNTPVSSGIMELTENGTSVFGVFERDDTFNDLRNNGTVSDVGTFDNLATPPALPNFP
jgi:hypothetical protein